MFVAVSAIIKSGFSSNTFDVVVRKVSTDMSEIRCHGEHSSRAETQLFANDICLKKKSKILLQKYLPQAINQLKMFNLEITWKLTTY
jgi:hypothetical protein